MSQVVVKIENYTPHSISLYKESEKVHEFPSQGDIRLKEIPQQNIAKWKGIPVYSAPEYTGLDGVPEHLLEEKGEDLGIIVSMPVGKFLASEEHKKSLPGRIHVFGPDTGPKSVVRGEKGEILGAKALIRYK